MFCCKKIFALALIATGLFIVKPVASSPEPPYNTRILKWTVQKTSTLRILGSSNINSFGCDIQGCFKTDTLFCSDEMCIDKTVKLKGSICIDILKFDCHNELITGDLRKTLKASQHPNLVIRFVSLEHFPALQNTRDCLKGYVEIELAGVCKKFQVDYSFETSGSSSVRLNGSRSFCFSDFNLTPPKKLAGLIKVKDDFDVNFQLLLNRVE